MKQTARLNQVTPVSKILAAVVFITLPFIGFFVGFTYQNELNDMYKACMDVEATPAVQTTQQAN